MSKTTLLTWCLSLWCSEDPKLWAFGGPGTTAAVAKPTGIYFFWEVTPAAHCQSEGCVRPGHAVCQKAGWRCHIQTSARKQRQEAEGAGFAFPSPSLHFHLCFRFSESWGALIYIKR